MAVSLSLIPFGSLSQSISGATAPNHAKLEKTTSPMIVNNHDISIETLWYLKLYRNEEQELIPAEVFSESPSLEFRNSRISGNATCNRFFGTYSLEGKQLSIMTGGSTKIACPGELMVQEERFLKMLEQVASYELTRDELHLLNTDGEILLSFQKAIKPPLTNTNWQLTAYNNGKGGVVSLIAGTNITGTFHVNGGLTGFAGCNNYIFNYEVAEESIKISSGISTRKFCGQPEGIMAQESAYLQALGTATTYSIDGNNLTLRNATGEAIAQFKAIQ